MVEFVSCGVLRFSNANTTVCFRKMEFMGQSMLLNIKLVVLSLLLLVQLPGPLGSDLLKDSNTCGTYHIGYSDDSKEKLFYINGELVDRYLFCKALKLYQKNRCLITRNVRHQYCSLNYSLGNMRSLCCFIYVSNVILLEKSLSEVFGYSHINMFKLVVYFL